MEIGKEIKYGELPYKIHAKIEGHSEPIFVLEPIHESEVFRCYKIHVTESELILGSSK